MEVGQAGVWRMGGNRLVSRATCRYTANIVSDAGMYEDGRQSSSTGGDDWPAMVLTGANGEPVGSRGHNRWATALGRGS